MDSHNRGTETTFRCLENKSARAESSLTSSSRRTNSVAWRIIDHEAATREKKTEKLRALRLAKEVTNPALVPKLKRK